MTPKLYAKELVTSEQLETGFKLRQHVFENSLLVKKNIVKSIKDSYDDNSRHWGFYSNDELCASVRIVKMKDQKVLPCYKSFSFSEVQNVQPETTVEVSRLAVANKKEREVLILFKLLEAITFKYYAQTILIALGKNPLVYCRLFNFSLLEERSGISLLRKDAAQGYSELKSEGNLYYLA